MGQRTILLIISLLAAVVLVATFIDLVAPDLPLADSGFVFSLLRRTLPDRAEGTARRSSPAAQFALPRASRALAGAAALAGYGFMLYYLRPQECSALVRRLRCPPRGLLRYGVAGLALLLLLVILTLLSGISLIAFPLVPLFSLGSGIALLTGLVALSAALGQSIRARIGDMQAYPLIDLFGIFRSYGVPKSFVNSPGVYTVRFSVLVGLL